MLKPLDKGHIEFKVHSTLFRVSTYSIKALALGFYLPQNPITYELRGHIPLTLLVCPISFSLLLVSPLVTNYGENASLRAKGLELMSLYIYNQFEHIWFKDVFDLENYGF